MRKTDIGIEVVDDSTEPEDSPTPRGAQHDALKEAHQDDEVTRSIQVVNTNSVLNQPAEVLHESFDIPLSGEHCSQKGARNDASKEADQCTSSIEVDDDTPMPHLPTEVVRAASDIPLSEHLFQKSSHSNSLLHYIVKKADCGTEVVNISPNLHIIGAEVLASGAFLDPLKDEHHLQKVSENVLSAQKVHDQPGPLSICDMLKWYFVVLDEGLLDNVAVCNAMSFESPSPPEPKGWREEAALKPKKHSDKKKASKENQSKNYWSKQPELKESENSWSVRQKKRVKNLNVDGKSDEEIVRTMKSILNKLTLEKYDTLYQQILHCGISTVEHVVILIDEVLEKVETQHQFIHMYCQLCVDLHKWFDEQVTVDTLEMSFRHILLNQCQNKFEDYLLPIELGSMKEDEVEEAMIKHKLAMLGNIKFIGALLEKRMLNEVVMIGVARQLCDADALHTVESLACVLTAVGGMFVHPSFKHHDHLKAIFARVEEKSKDKGLGARIRFLLRDLLDLREAGWKRAGETQVHRMASQPDRHRARR